MTVIKIEKTIAEKVSDYIGYVFMSKQVRFLLLFHRLISVIKTKVDTKDGVVIVNGVAKNTAEKDLVSKFINNIKG